MSSNPGTWVLISLVAVAPCFGREIFHLASGFALEATSHAQIEDKLVLTTATGTVELTLADVANIEIIPDIKPDLSPGLTTAKADPVLSAAELVRLAAASQGNAPEFIRLVECVARVESGLKKDAISSKGALGLMQLMPNTAKGLGVIATDPRQNAEGGARYLRELLEIYGHDSVLALAAYNAGPGAVQKYRGVPPFAETRQYVRKVLREYAGAAPGAKPVPEKP